MSHEDEFVSGLKALAKMCKFEMSDWSMDAYSAIFESIGYDKGISALKIAFLKTTGQGRMPSPLELAATIGIREPDAIKPRDEALDRASRIIQAIPKFGYARAIEAKTYLGDELWSAVEKNGGWEYLCNTELDNLSTVKAQLRDLIESTTKIEQNRAFVTGLNSSNNKQVEGMIKMLTESNGMGI